MEAGSGGGAEEEALVENFRAVTASTQEEARFFLESHNWMLDAAIHSFFDSDDTAAVQQDDDYIPAQGQAQAQASAAAAPASPGQPLPPAGRAPPRSVGPRDNNPPAAGRPAIRTLADLNRRPSPVSDDDSDESQEYYTGGEKSGMLVRDPSKGNHDVDAIFEQARQMGALEGPLEHHPSSSSRNFTGTGRLLSGETVQPPAPQQPENIIHNICFWRNGFTVNDGPLRRFDDPENASFLESIRKSECPKELEPADRRSTVNVNLIRKEENCPEPVKRHTPFQGVGRTLGSGSSSGPASSEPAVDAAASIPSSSSGLFVDESLPTTSIQLRLADGTRMIARFNTHHTVGDIRAFINASRPGAGIAYQLQTVDFPPKQLTDVAKTIEDAGLSNSVIIQRI